MVHHTIPGHSDIWERYEAQRGSAIGDAVAAAFDAGDDYAETIGTSADAIRWLREAESAGIDHVIFLQQGVNNRHDDICDSLRLFGSDVLGAFSAGRSEREAAKAEELAPYIEKALARKEWMRPLERHEVPVVETCGRVASARSRRRAEPGSPRPRSAPGPMC